MRLYLTWRGEQGVRVATFLTGRDGWTPTREIADRAAVPGGQVARVVADLGRAGILVNRSGSRGGCRSAVAPEQITVLDVVEALEGPLAPHVCLLDRRRCPEDGTCGLHEAWAGARAAVIEALGSVTLRDLQPAEAAPRGAG